MQFSRYLVFSCFMQGFLHFWGMKAQTEGQRAIRGTRLLPQKISKFYIAGGGISWPLLTYLDPFYFFHDLFGGHVINTIWCFIMTIETRTYTGNVYGLVVGIATVFRYFLVSWGHKNPTGSWPTLYWWSIIHSESRKHMWCTPGETHLA